MEEDTEYLKLPIEDRCVHKAWKARVNGYEEAKKLFNQIDDEKSPEWNKFLGLLKKMVVDSNAVAQEKGLEAVLVYVENCAVAGKTVGDVISGLVAKCIGAPKAKTKELAVQIALMYVEIEKHEIVLEELLKGTEQKNPKVVSGCINLITQALREFGIKVVTIKPILKRLPSLIEDRDKTVREETKALVVEMFRWIGAALNPQLTFLKPIQLSELQTEFDKLNGEKAVPTRYLRSQQAKQAKIAAETVNADEGGEEDECDDGGAGDVDPYELMVAVDILSRLPKDFYDKVEAKKWQERKEALDTVDQMLQGGPKLESGDYGDLVRALKKMITKDSNVVIVALATKCLASIANGLKKRFQPYAVACISGLLEKFKEKKQNVVIALREAVDAIYISTTLEAIQEDVLAALENKNPSVRAETGAFLARCFTKCTPVILNKKLLKAFCAVLLKTLNESDPTVRDASAEALGTAMKVVGEKGIAPFLADVDNLKMAKIKEACDKAELQVKQPKAVAKKPAAAVERPASAKHPAGSAAPKPVKRPAGSTVKKPAAGASGAKKTASSSTAKSKPVAEREMTPEDVDEKAEVLFPAELLSGLADTNWKSRMAAVEQFNQMLATLDPAEAPSQLLLRLINKKPGLKDTNFQVAKLRLDAVKIIAQNYPVSTTAMSCVVTDVAEKLSDAKTQSAACDALTALAEATKLEQVAGQLLEYSFTQKNPKVQVEVFNWLGNAIQEFGFGFQPKVIMDNVKKGVTAINPAVRSAAISLVGILSMYMGNQVMLHFDGEKPALMQQISAEVDKHVGEAPPNAVRGSKKNEVSETRRSSVDTVLSGAADEEEEEEEAAPAVETATPARRVDLSQFLNDTFISELSDKNWKVRAEAVQKLQTMVTESKAVSSSLGECPPVLAARLVDSNTKIAAATLALCQSLAIAMGPDCRQHVRVFLPNFLVGMGDTKTWIRAAAISCINTWAEQCGYKEFFEGEMIADALKSGSPALRSELWGWLAEKLPNIKTVPKEEMVACIPSLLSNLEDRNADVRKNAADAVLGVMIHTGYGPLSKACEKLKPGSQGPVKAILEKARGNLPEKPVQKSKSASNIPSDKSKVNAKMGPGSTATFVKSKPKAAAAGAGAKATGRKKEAEEDTSPLMQNNSMKNQRALDEQRLKTLKWNFTTPREEFVELLKDRMLAAGVNKGLITNMFHVDFKFHLRAIDMLSEDLAPNFEAQRANLDLILKWLTIRFFDTNPSVILKGLEYLQTLFENLNNEGYSMIDNEVASFVPYLLIKIGDPKDTVRNSVKMILRQMWHLSSVQKLFPYLMDGVRSKNARQRAECLEHVSVMIDQNGLSACVPSASVALKEIAKQISDRDNSVRNAALNCIVTAYYHDERALKMVGQISDKDLSLLEERIKRASKNRPVANVKPLQQAPPTRAPPRDPSPAPAYEDMEPDYEEELPPPPVHNIQSIASPPVVTTSRRSYTISRVSPLSPPEPEQVVYDEEIDDSLELNDVQVPMRRHHVIHDSFELMYAEHQTSDRVVQYSYDENGVNGTEQLEPRPVSGPYGLDQALLHDIETQPIVCSQPKLIEFDLHFLKEPSTVMNPAPLLDHSLNSSLSRMPNSMTLEWYLTQIGNRDFDRALEALAHIESLLVSEQHKQLYQHEDMLVAQLVRQLEFLNQSNHPEVVNCYRRNLGLFVKFFNHHPELSRNVKESTLREALKVLITLLTEKRLEILVPGTDMFVRVVNNVIIRVLDKSDHTSVICALVKNLYDTVNNPAFSSHYQELLMKCTWKVIKFIDCWADELQYDLIFTDIHAFLRDFPSSWWKKQPSDTPLRTIKTIMHTIVKVNGPVIGEIVSNVRGVTSESELWTYVQKLLKHIKCTNEDPKIAPIMDNQLDNKESLNMSRGKRMSKDSHDLLSEIFRKIGTKDETNEGIRMLYEFKQKNPDADINPFLQKSTKFFQDYIERGLKSIEADRRLAGVDKDIGKMELEDKDSGAYLQRLRAWQAKAGWHNAPPATTRPTTTPLSPPRQDPDLEPLPVRQSQLDVSNESITADESEVEALRKRLEKVKSSLVR